ncbi:MAG: hypothetical protein O3C40_21285 [Planctomycetota bacterium]|nr:hypothetical protein [Planctomycetota bacterium]
MQQILMLNAEGNRIAKLPTDDDFDDDEDFDDDFDDDSDEEQ